MTDADVLAIKAYLFSLPAVSRRKNERDTLQFPFDQRWSDDLLVMGVQSQHALCAEYRKEPQWNRGAYVAEALAHCGSCHTPRNPAFALVLTTVGNLRVPSPPVGGLMIITSDKGTGIGPME